jgi:hypothetical protein
MSFNLAVANEMKRYGKTIQEEKYAASSKTKIIQKAVFFICD